jgi:hypothetical protein
VSDGYERDFARGFKLHLDDGTVLDGAEFPSSRLFVLDHREHGFAHVATDRDALLEVFPGARFQWPGEPEASTP